MNKYLLFIIGYTIFTMGMGYWMTGNTLGYMTEYNIHCDSEYNVPKILFVEPSDASYYFKNPDATCEKLFYLNLLTTGLVLFVLGMGFWQLYKFTTDMEVRIVVRRRY